MYPGYFFNELCNKGFLLQVKDRRVDSGVCMIVLGCRCEYAYDGLRACFMYESMRTYICMWISTKM